MKIKNIETSNNIFLAPMAGYTDVAFREQCIKFGAGLTTTEMVSASGLIYDSEKTKKLLITSKLEKIKAVQLFGHDPEIIAKAINHEVLNQFDIIDINMGCPAPKIVKNGDGSYLLTKPELAERIIRKAVSATNKPITVKMRLGYDKDVSVEFAKMLERAGASAITVHGRLKTQGYSGEANYEAIAKVKQAVSIPVIANGDVRSVEDYKKIIEITKADAVMIGRGAIGNPFIFSDILEKNVKHNKFEVIKAQYKLLLNYYDEFYVVNNMRKQLAHYLKGENVNSETKLQLMQLNSAKEVLNLLKNVLK